MRDILFRAKRLDNGEWAYSKTIAANTPLDGSGDRWFIGAGQPADQYIHKNGNMIAVETKGECLFYAISAETIGQFTGMVDKNDKKIFEGDIIRSSDPEMPESTFDCGIGQVEFYGGLWYVSGGLHNGLNDLWLSRDIEVIGNIHDTPELLED